MIGVAADLPRLDGLSVLLLEDNDDFRDTLESILQQCGADTIPAARLAEARAALEGRLPDVIVADLVLPDGTGTEFVRWLRELPLNKGGPPRPFSPWSTTRTARACCMPPTRAGTSGAARTSPGASPCAASPWPIRSIGFRMPRASSSTTASPHRPETAVLRCCGRARLSPEHRARLRELLAQRIDWDILLGLARGHGMVPLLSRHLLAHADPLVPAAARDSLRRHVTESARRTLALTGELLRLLRLLRDAHIPALVLKGPVLALAAYGDLTLREFGDLDLLVRPRHAGPARELLHAAGYRPRTSIDRRREAAFLSSQCAELFLDGGPRFAVDFHWNLFPPYFGVDFDLEQLWRAAGTVTIGGEPVPTLGPDDTLLYLSAHGAKHCWERLEWLVAVAELVRRRPDLDAGRVLERARSLGIRRMVALALHLAHTLLEVPLASGLVKTIGRDRMVHRLAANVCARLAQPAPVPAGLLEGIHFQAAARERLLHRVRCCWRLAATPTVGDWGVVTLPQSLGLAYRLVRPFRLALKYARR